MDDFEETLAKIREPQPVDRRKLETRRRPMHLTTREELEKLFVPPSRVKGIVL
jgi:hypothetical protein